MRQVDARNPSLRGSKDGGVRVGDGLDERKTACDQTECEQKDAEDDPLAGDNLRHGNKADASDGNHGKTKQDPPTVAITPGQDPGRKRQQEITSIPEPLNQGRLGLGHLQGILKVFVEHINHAVAQPRKTEQAADQQKGRHMTRPVRRPEHGG